MRTMVEALRRSVGATCVLSVLSACGGQGDAQHAGADQIPLLVSFEPSTVVVGLAGGRMRERESLAAFQITKQPITVADYAECVSSGGCRDAAATGCQANATNLLGAFKWREPASPAICVGVPNANAYCRWIGGRLPTVAEWQLAARGPEPRRFPWGDREPTCADHPLARKPAVLDDPNISPRDRLPCHAVGDDAPLIVGQSPGVPGAEGAQDFLLSSAELLAASERSLWNACLKDVTSSCIVYGEGGGIDAVQAVGNEADGALVPYAFRCVVEN